MCGRFFLTVSGEEIRQRFRCVNTIDWQPRYNVAPSQPIPAVLPHEGRRRLETLRWGLIPFWAKDEAIGQRLVNARAETLAERPAFREALKRRRCLIPASGFYEWRRTDRHKQPYAIRRRDGDLMAFAGLWERWRHPDSGEECLSCIIITTDANRLLRPLHRRMPAILEEAYWDQWLDPAAPDPQTLLGPCREEILEAYPVSPYVNNPRNDDPRCLEPLQPTEALFG
ncbi:MAG TPA: SOS response-associated peptidase [Methylothermaceae bacterium]|nr:SOS response-associated peptidase [Methylothermaceae bacterium]